MFKNLLSIQQCNILIRSALTGTRRGTLSGCFLSIPSTRISHRTRIWSMFRCLWSRQWRGWKEWDLYINFILKKILNSWGWCVFSVSTNKSLIGIRLLNWTFKSRELFSKSVITIQDFPLYLAAYRYFHYQLM